MEPLARCVQQALDALGWKAAKAAEVTGLSSQHLSQILHRKKNYVRPPSPQTLQALAKIPGLSHLDILRAVGESTGIGRPQGAEPFVLEWSASRRTVHNLVDKLPEEKLNSVTQILIAMLD